MNRLVPEQNNFLRADEMALLINEFSITKNPIN